MKSAIILLFLLAWAVSTFAFESREIPLDEVKTIALRNATEFWGKVYADEPIPLYDRKGDLLAWQFNYCKGQPFPEKAVLMERIKETGNNLADATWNTEEFGCITLGARTDKPVIMGYANSLSYEYAYAMEIDSLAKLKLKGKYDTLSQIFVSFGSRWSVVTDGNTEYYVKALAPCSVLTREEFLTATEFPDYPPRQNDYSTEWNESLAGHTQTREVVYIPHPELMPSIRWSYGCSPTAGVTVAAYWDNTSMDREGDYSKLIGSNYTRYEPNTEETCHHLPDALPLIADFMDTDSGGSTMPWNVNDGMEDFFTYKGHSSWCYNNDWIVDYLGNNGAMYSDLMTEIDWGQPTIMNIWGHTVVGYGYNSSSPIVAVHNSNSPALDNWHISEFYQLVQVHPRPKDGCSITLLHPDGGHGWVENGTDFETYQAGSIMEISWVSDNVPNTHVEIYYTPVSAYGNDNWWEIITLNAPNNGSYGWSIPTGLNGADFRVLVQVMDAEGHILGADGSYGSFTINAGGAVPTLVNDVSTVIPSSPVYYKFPTTSAAWTVVGIRKPIVLNGGTSVHSKLGLYDQNFASQLISSSSYSKVNWLALDRTHTAYAQMGLKTEINPYTSENELELEAGMHSLSLGANTGLLWLAGDVVKMWDVSLSPGTYSFTLSTTENTNLGFGLCSSFGSNYFHSPATLSGFCDNSESSSSESFSLTVTNADTYGLIVWANAAFTGFVNITIGYPGYWTGNVDTNWSNAGNWATGVVPTASSDVVIPTGVTRYPVINYPGTVQCRDLILDSGASLNIRGNLTVNGSATIAGNLVLGSTNPVLNIVNNLTWASTAEFDNLGAAAINISGNWLVNSGSEVQLTSATVNFIGNSDCRIQVNSSTNSFYHLNINKSGGAEVLVDEETDKVTNILGNLSVASGAAFVNTCDYDLKLYGNLSSAGGILFQNCLLHIYNRLSAQSITLGSSDIIHSLKIDSASTVTLNSNLTLYGSMFIAQGILDAGNRQITVYGSWYNDAGEAALAGANHTVRFFGSNNEECYETGFKNLELSKDNGAELQVPIGKRLVCEDYNWSSGSLRVKSGAEFSAADLVDIRIMGRYYLEGGLIELHQDINQYVDLDADIYIYSGAFNIYGGASYASEWAYTRTITVFMNGGILDFKNNGILLSSTGYYLSDIISGGIIRTSGDFKVERPGFNPTGGIVEMYGAGSAILHVNSPSYVNHVIINKASREGSGRQSEERINQVTVNSNTKISGYCIVQSGSLLQVDNCQLTIDDYLKIHGGIRMDNANELIEVDGLGSYVSWEIGSSALNLTAGTIRTKDDHYIQAGSSVILPAAVNFSFIGDSMFSGDLYVYEPLTVLGTLTNEISGRTFVLHSTGISELNFSGDVIVKATATTLIDDHLTNCLSVHIAGKIDIWSGGTLTLAEGIAVYATNLYNSGLLNLPDDFTGSMNIGNTFLQYASGRTALHGGSLIINSDYNGTMYLFGGITNMSGGSLQITNNGMQIGTSGFNFTGGTIKLGWSFAANNPDTFKAEAGSIEMIGERQASISLASENYLPTLVINKTGITGAVSLYTDISTKLDIAVSSGKLYVNGHKLTINQNLEIAMAGYLYNNNSADQIELGGRWTNNGSAGNFLEGSGLVSFITSSNLKSIATNETFNRLVINTGSGYVTVDTGITVTVLNNLEITSGKFRPLDGTTLSVQGNLQITGANSFLDQNFRRETASTNVHIMGNLIVNLGTIYSLDTNGAIPLDVFTVDGIFEMTGGVINALDLAMTVHGNFSTTTASYVEMRGGTFINDAPYTGSWQLINCEWVTWGNTIEFTNKGLQFVTGANVDNNSYSVFKLGRGLYAITDNVLCEENGTFEFIGSVQANINLGGNNKLHNVTVNKTSAALILSTNATITGDLTIQSGSFNTNNFTLELGNDWTNNVGTSGYTCGTSEVICRNTGSSYNPQTVTGNQSFYKLTINHPTNAHQTIIDESNTTILSDLTVSSGGFHTYSEAVVQVNSNVSIASNAYLLSSGHLKIKGNLTDNNSSLSWVEGSRKGLLAYPNSTLTLNGTNTQTITVGTPEINLGGFSLDKSSGNFQPTKPMLMSGNVTLLNGTWGFGTSGLTHAIGGNFAISSTGNWSDNTGTVKFTGNQNSSLSNSGTANFKNLWIDKTVAGGYYPTVLLASNFSLGTAGTVTLDGGDFNTGAYTLQTKGDVNINSEGKMVIAAGGTLKMLSGSSINVMSGGTLSANGSESSVATITHITGNYNLNVNSGGTLNAECAIFEYTGSNGVYIMSGGLIESTNPLSYCTFRYGYSSGTLLRLDNAQNLVIDYASFPSGATSFNNVSKTSNQGIVQFTNETGGWAGTSHENDPYSRINWSSDVPQIQVNPATINFGEVPYTQSSSRHILISNPGSAVLHGTISTPSNFSITPWGRLTTAQSGTSEKPEYEPARNVLDFSVGIGGSNEFVLTFTPTDPIYYSNTVVVTHNAANSPFNINVDGYGSGARIEVDHAFFNIDVQPGETVHRLLNLSNTGVDSLVFSGWVNYSRNDRSSLLYTGFEDGCPPTGWTETQTMGTEGHWYGTSVTSHPIGITPHEGSSLGYFNSYNAHTGNRTRLQSPGIDVANYTGLTLSFWMYHDNEYPTYYDTLQVQVSVNGGSWIDAGFSILRCTMPNGWRQHTIDLSAYDQSANIQIGILAKSGYGNDMHIDEVQLSGNYQMPTDWITLNDNFSISGNIAPEDPALPIDISVNSTGLPSGWYMNQLRFFSNDPGNPDLAVGLIIRIGTPDYTFSPSTLNFGAVEVGETDTLGFEILNTGEIGLSGTISTPTGYTVELTSAPRQQNSPYISSRSNSASRNEVEFYLYPGINATFVVHFTPIAAIAYNGQITISTNTGTDEYLPLTGLGAYLPSLTTAAITNVGVDYATGGGEITSTGNTPLLERGICWYTTENPTLEYYHASAPGSLGSYSLQMNDLLTNQDYYVRAYATNAIGTAYGEQVTFSTPAPWLTVSTDSLSFGYVPMGESSLPQNVTISGGNLVAPVIIYSPNAFQISLSPDSGYSMDLSLEPSSYVLSPTIVYIKFSPMQTGLWTDQLLPSSTGCSLASIALSGTGVLPPEVETATIVNITSVSASVNARVLSDGFAPLSACGVCYGTSAEPTIAELHTDEGNQSGWFTSELTGLIPNTMYYIRSYALNVAGLVYGNELSFSTVPIPQISVVDSLLNPFGSIVVGEFSAIDTLIVSAQQLMDNLVITAPTGFELSLNLGVREFGSQLSIAPVTGNVEPTTVYIRFAPDSGGNLSNYLSFESTGISGVNTMLNGIGVTPPNLISTTASGVTSSSALTGGEIIHSGWDAVSACVPGRF
ncbi:MAG: hypothetical protein PHO32_01175 [Candidatus Cloacimonetes bacterium]|nr:hypothetical protein [Candidatus Cloacimonadota bacterium]